MAQQYYLVDPPAGVNVNPNTGIVYTTGGTPEDLHNIQLWSYDTETGEQKLCENAPLYCRFPEQKKTCEECIDEHLNQEQHLTKTEVDECIDHKISTALIDWIPPQQKKDCYDKQILRISYCGRIWDVTDWDGLGIASLNITPKFYTYIESPNNEDAQIKPTIENFKNTGNLPIAKYAGITNDYGEIDCITHISDGKKWLALGGTTTKNISQSNSKQKCVIGSVSDFVFPTFFDTSTSVWQIGQDVVHLSECPTQQETFCASETYNTTINNLQKDACSKPDILGITDINGFYESDFSATLCAANLTSINSVEGGVVYALDTDVWSFKNGKISPDQISSLTISFRAEGAPTNFGVGVYDFSGNVWQPTSGGDGFQLNQGADFYSVGGTGDYGLSFAIDPNSYSSNDIRVIFYAISGSETIKNIRFNFEYTLREPCGKIETVKEFIQVLNEKDLYGNVWTVNSDNEICAYMPKGLCQLYTTPVFYDTDGINCCQVSDAVFPLQYNPLSDGWIVGSRKVPLTGVGVFQTAEDLAQFMRENDPKGYTWVENLNSDGTWNICANIKPEDKNFYQGMTFSGQKVFCIAENVSFPIGYNNEDGWLRYGQFQTYPVGSRWDNPEDLTNWATGNDLGNSDWFYFLDDPVNETYSICAVMEEEKCVNYTPLSFLGSDIYCCVANNLIFPLGYDPKNDGLIFNNEIIPFGGDGFFESAEDLKNYLDEQTENIWTIQTGEVEGSNNFCSFIPRELCQSYSGLSISGGETYHCEFTNVAFPLNTIPSQGWEVNGQFISFPVEVFYTPEDFAETLKTLDPNSYNWGYQISQNGNGSWDFCAFMPTSSVPAYGGLINGETVCNFILSDFPYSYPPGSGWLINGVIVPYASPNNEFVEIQDFVDWLDSTDPNGSPWFYDVATSSNEISRFCTVADPAHEGDYGGFYESNLFCIASDITYPLSYNSLTGGWLVEDTFVPFGGDGVWDNPQELLDWVVSADSNFGQNYWFVDGDSICGYIKFWQIYGQLDFNGNQQNIFTTCQNFSYNIPFEPNPGMFWQIAGKKYYLNPENEDCIYSFEMLEDFMTNTDPHGYNWHHSGNNNFCAQMPPEDEQHYEGFGETDSECISLDESFPWVYQNNTAFSINGQNFIFDQPNNTFTSPSHFAEAISSLDESNEWFYKGVGAGGEHFFCTLRTDGNTNTYEGVSYSNYVCIAAGLQFPLNYTSNSILVANAVTCHLSDSPGTFRTAKDLLEAINGINDNNWFLDANGGICAWVDSQENGSYWLDLDNQPTNECFNFNQQFPWNFDTGTGVEIAGEFLVFDVHGNVIPTPEYFAEVMTSLDPFGNEWIYNGVNQAGLHVFCSPGINSAELLLYSATKNGIYKCIANNLTFPLDYDEESHWTVGGVQCYLSDSGGQYRSVKELLDAINSSDSYGNEWFLDANGDICAWVKPGDGPYGDLQL